MEARGFFFADKSEIKFKEWDTREGLTPMHGRIATLGKCRNTRKREKLIAKLNKEIGANLTHKKQYEDLM
ncbi:MAG: hypothetical protein RI580_18445 [Halothece sp. Uz-M2-17]|nr:hypothetical protein [Halothece sp. Uz-M2-17]